MAVLGNWPIPGGASIEPLPSYWGKSSLVVTADGRRFILKEKSDLAKAERESLLLSRLARLGAPVAAPLRTTGGAWCTSSEDKVFCLYPQLPGATISDHFAEGAEERAKRFGTSIGFLHTCLVRCGDEPASDEPTRDRGRFANGFRQMNLIRQLREWAIPRVRESPEAGEIVRLAEQAVDELDATYGALPAHLIHRDLHPANMLFDRGVLSGFLDFEMVVRGPRIFDICYCATSILVGGFQDPAKVERWPGLFRSIVKGYEEVSPLTPTEPPAVYGVMAAIQLLFAAFSLETRAEAAARCNARVLRWLAGHREALSL
jgi:Ser/Thr protein kinase RdoA (MazF antagonist)